MKKYVKPQLQTEEFVAQEYIATCYKVQCKTDKGNNTYYYLYQETNNKPGLQVNDGNGYKADKLCYSSKTWGFSGCNKWHGGVITTPTKNGYVVKQKQDNNNLDCNVFVWKEDLGADSDWHCSYNPESAKASNPRTSD